MCKDRSVWKDWYFVSRDMELSVGRFLIEYFTPLTLGEQLQGTLSNEDVTEVWEEAQSETINKVRKVKGGPAKRTEGLTQMRRK